MTSSQYYRVTARVGVPHRNSVEVTLPLVGPAGPAGASGAAGAAATVAVGAVATGVAGSSAAVTNAGTSSAAVFDFAIPRGDKGDTGEVGPAGPQGTTDYTELDNVPSTFTPSAHAASHLPEGADEIFDQSLNTTDNALFLNVETELDVTVGGDLYINNALVVGANGILFQEGGDSATRTNLGLGPAALEDFAAPPAIGNTTPAAGSFTTLNLPDGARTTPSFFFADDTDTGFFRRGVNTLTFVSGGAARFEIGGQGPRLSSNDFLAWAFNADLTGASDLALHRDAGDTLAQRRGTNAQEFRIYNTFTSATNHERGFLKWSSNVFQIGTEKGSGGGTARQLDFQTDGVTRCVISSGGSFQCLGDLVIATRARIRSGGEDGVIRLVNLGATGFNRLELGGGTSSFPAIKRDSTTLQARLADDSAFTAIQASNIVLTDNTGSETATFDAQAKLTDDRTYDLPDASGTLALTTLLGTPIEYVIACSDETSDLATGTAKVTFRAPVAFKLTGVSASVNTAPTDADIEVDINNGANSTLSTKLSIDADEKTSATAASAAVIDTDYDDIAADAEITIDIDQIGSTIAGKGLKVVLKGVRA